MKVKVLGSSGAEFPGFHPPGFLIDGKILFDGGTIGASLKGDDQWKIRYVAITHAHLDHIKGIPFLADNIFIQNKKHNVTVIGIAPALKALKENLLNKKVWPDFTKIPGTDNAVLKFMEIKPNQPLNIDGYKLTAYRVNHSIPAVAYILEDKRGKRLLYTGDTGPTYNLWKMTCCKKIQRAIIETSFPNNMVRLALKTGHLTPELLKKEIDKMEIVPDKILITHPKPQHLKTISSEIKRLSMPNIKILKDGELINF
jgi:ribonuclease BN (tRNA processing enzyme)